MPYDYFNRLKQQMDEQNGTASSPGAAGGLPLPVPAGGISEPADPSTYTPAGPGYSIGAQNAGSGTGGRSVAGSTFENFGDMYRANAGKAQAMAKRLAGTADTQGTQAYKDMTGAQNNFVSAVDQGSAGYTPYSPVNMASPTDADANYVTPTQKTPGSGPAATGTAIPDSVKTVDQAVASGYSPDQIVAKFGYAAYSDSVGAATSTQKGSSNTGTASSYNPGAAPGTSVTRTGEGQVSASTKGGTAYDNATQGAVPGAITPAELQARAAQKYTGPTSFGNYLGADAYANLGTEAQKAQDYATGLDTGAGVQTALGYNGSTGISREDAALAQGAGAGAFSTLAKRYGGLLGQLGDISSSSDQMAANAAGQESDAAAQYQADLDRYDASQAADQAGRDTRAAANAAASDAELRAEFEKENQAAMNSGNNTARIGLDIANPIGGIADLASGGDLNHAGSQDWNPNEGGYGGTGFGPGAQYGSFGGNGTGRDAFGAYTNDDAGFLAWKKKHGYA